MKIELAHKGFSTMESSWIIETNKRLFQIYLLNKLSHKEKYYIDELVTEMTSIPGMEIEEESISAILLSLAKAGLVIYKLQVTAKTGKRKFYRLTEAGTKALNQMTPCFETFITSYQNICKK